MHPTMGAAPVHYELYCTAIDVQKALYKGT